jgi:hypothetical protein
MLVLCDFKIKGVTVAECNKLLFIVFDLADYFGFLHSFQQQFGLDAFSDVF